MTTIEHSADEVQEQTASRDVLRHIKAALGNLALADCRLNDRLLLTLQHLDAALAERDGWPVGLYDRAYQVAAELNENREWINRGGGSTVRRLNEALGQRILELAIDLEVAVRIEPRPIRLPVDALGAEDVTPALISGCSRYFTTTESSLC